MLICTRKGQLYAKAAISSATSILAVTCSDCTILIIQANKLRLAFTWCTAIPFPKQILQSALLKFYNQSKTGHYMGAIRNKCRRRSRGIFWASKSHHITTSWIRRKGGGIDGEERDLVDLRAEKSELRVSGGERKAAIARRELEGSIVVEEEGWPRWEGNAEGEAIALLNSGVAAWGVDAVGVVALHWCDWDWCNDEYE